jgi:hypothetical protein
VEGLNLWGLTAEKYVHAEENSQTSSVTADTAFRDVTPYSLTER